MYGFAGCGPWVKTPAVLPKTTATSYEVEVQRVGIATSVPKVSGIRPSSRRYGTAHGEEQSPSCSSLSHGTRNRWTERSRWASSPSGVSRSPQAWDILNHIGKGSSLLAIPFWCSYTVLKTKSRGKPSPLWEDESHERLIHTTRKTALTICCFHLGL